MQRTVHTLQKLSYIGKQPQTRRFQLLSRVIESGFNCLAAHSLIRAANPYLSQLANAGGETASLTEAVGLDMAYLVQLVISKFIPVNTPVGMCIPMYRTSSGRAWFSMQTDDTVRTIRVQSTRAARTPATLTDVNAIFEPVAACRQVGYANNYGELCLSDMGIAAPIRGSRGQPLGAVYLSPPASRWTLEEAQKKLSSMAIECAQVISRSIAH